MPDIDTSNPWVYEGFLAVMLHGCLFVSRRAYVFASILRDHGEKAAQPTHVYFELFFTSFSGPAGIAILVMVAIIFIPLMAPTLWDIIFRSWRDGSVWLAKAFKIGYESYHAGGLSIRLFLALLSMILTIMIVKETIRLRDEKMQTWNQN